MKHFLMAFLILFSALSSSWVGAVVFSVSQNERTLSVKQMVLEEGNIASVQHQEHSVNSCSSMSSEVNEGHEYCVNCFDQCQCDESACHKMNSPLVGVHLEPINIQNMAKISPIFVSSQLQKAPVFLDFRPPKIS